MSAVKPTRLGDYQKERGWGLTHEETFPRNAEDLDVKIVCHETLAVGGWERNPAENWEAKRQERACLLEERSLHGWSVVGKEPAGQRQRGPFTEGLVGHIRSLGRILGPVRGPKRVFNQRRAVDQFVLKRC